MRWIAAVSLVMLWLSLLVTGATFGGLIHILLIPALAILLLNLPRPGESPEA
ncbi:MAG TPA: lmo0937 family membrane protein [Candidatus Limnocylindria bacterium]|jgi:hypothetical protein